MVASDVFILLYVNQLANRIVYVLSYVGNKGTNDKGFLRVVTEPQFLIHIMNIFFCFLGLFFNELCYSVLVSSSLSSSRVLVKTYILSVL